MTSGQRVALALGGGGARGYAHIGVIRELEERGHEIVAVAGTSMGAVIGGLYCAGTLDPYTEWVIGLTQRDVIRLLDPSIKAPGLIKAEKVMSRVRELLAGKRIEDLPIPFTAVATDLIAQKEAWFQDGPVEAIAVSLTGPRIEPTSLPAGRAAAAPEDSAAQIPLGLRTLDLHRASELIELGRQHTRNVLDRETDGSSSRATG